MRAFLALPLEEKLILSVASAIEMLKKHCGSAKWIKPDQAHITLTFFEDISTVDANILIEKISNKLCEETFDIALHLGKLRCFPDVKKPRVLWVDILNENDDIYRLKGLIDS